MNRHVVTQIPDQISLKLLNEQNLRFEPFHLVHRVRNQSPHERDFLSDRQIENKE
ncbi:TPA: hypothetical protein OO122_001049 [Legionella pneumophila]|nr:hypothetical protein [Legionella pneumophila]HAT2066645.1 hypothetical protein [Legionella pneumophila]HCR5122611.1 hypothetical protein [Legionella pneumophila]HCR5125486.1 hypothetical protein [Legionella pneumophila]HCR5128475.1 hypothetical protein [Legionella pneumophila]HCR5131539.1 hypothetical protein [Legionella pneumophila]